MRVGYDWLLNKPGQDERERSLATCTLDGIAKFLCPTTNGDPFACLECLGFARCTAGQRAAALLDAETRSAGPEFAHVGPETEEMEPVAMEDTETATGEKTGPKKPWSEERRRKKGEESRKRGRNNCKTAIEYGNPFLYLVEVRGKTKEYALKTVARWKKSYPDLFSAGKTQEKTTTPIAATEAGRETTEMENNDLVSLEDFLAEYIADLPAIHAEPAPQIIDLNPNRSLAGMMQEEAELLRQIADLQERVWAIRAERKKLERKMSH